MEKRSMPVVIWAFIGGIALLTQIACPGPRHVPDSRLPPSKGVVLLFKALTYDSNLAKQRTEIAIGIVYAAGDQESEAQAREVLAAMQGVRGVRVRGLAIKPALVPLAGDDVDAAIGKAGVNMLFLTSGLEDSLPALCAVGAKRKALVATGEEEYVRACAGLGLLRRGKKAKVRLNLKAAVAQGSAFDERLLRVAEIGN